jgi:hypothetical protein
VWTLDKNTQKQVPEGWHFLSFCSFAQKLEFGRLRSTAGPPTCPAKEKKRRMVSTHFLMMGGENAMQERKAQAPVKYSPQLCVACLPPEARIRQKRHSLFGWDKPQYRWEEIGNVGMFYYCEAVAEQRAARCIVAAGALLERGLPRDVESLHPRACMEVPPMRELQNLLPRADHTEVYA